MISNLFFKYIEVNYLTIKKELTMRRVLEALIEIESENLLITD